MGGRIGQLPWPTAMEAQAADGEEVVWSHRRLRGNILPTEVPNWAWAVLAGVCASLAVALLCLPLGWYCLVRPARRRPAPAAPEATRSADLARSPTLLVSQGSGPQDSEDGKEPFVAFSMKLQGVQYPGLVAQPALRERFETAVRTAVAAKVAGARVASEHVSLALMPGSVIIRTMICPPSGSSDAATVIQQLDGKALGALGVAVASAVRAVPGIREVSDGQRIAITSVTAPKVGFEMDVPEEWGPMKAPRSRWSQSDRWIVKELLSQGPVPSVGNQESPQRGRGSSPPPLEVRSLSLVAREVVEHVRTLL